MTPEQQAAYVNSQAAILFATVAGMMAENAARAAAGNSPAYREDAFQTEIANSPCNHNSVIGLFRSY